MIHADRRNGAKSSPIVADTVGGVVASWLPDDLEGSDVVRAAVAKRLAAELDAPDLAGHAVPRIANALIAVVSAIDGTRGTGDLTQGMPPTRAQVSRLLDLVNSKGMTS